MRMTIVNTRAHQLKADGQTWKEAITQAWGEYKEGLLIYFRKQSTGKLAVRCGSYKGKNSKGNHFFFTGSEAKPYFSVKPESVISWPNRVAA